MDLEKLKYPIGEFEAPLTFSNELISLWVLEIEDFPEKLKKLTDELSIEKLNWKYRPDGWCVKQVVHHCADSHMNSMIRFKLALTETEPEIRPYYEDRWAELIDSVSDDITDSVMLITSLHRKWVMLLKELNQEQLALVFVHPLHGTRIGLNENIGIYAWHCRHHLAHISQAINSNGVYN